MSSLLRVQPQQRLNRSAQTDKVPNHPFGFDEIHFGAPADLHEVNPGRRSSVEVLSTITDEHAPARLVAVLVE